MRPGVLEVKYRRHDHEQSNGNREGHDSARKAPVAGWLLGEDKSVHSSPPVK
jgi:hypothetical protein